MKLKAGVVRATRILYERTGKAPYARQVAEHVGLHNRAEVVADILGDATKRGELEMLCWQYPGGATIVYAPPGVTDHGYTDET